MKFRTTSKKLSKALQQAIFTRKQSNLPILNFVKIGSNEYVKGQPYVEGITLSFTDLETTVSIHVPCEVIEAGSICLPAIELLNYLKPLDTTVRFEVNNEHIATLFTSDEKRQLLGLPAEDFPMIHLAKDPLFSISGKALYEMLKSVSYAMSEDATRFWLNGVYFETDKTHLRVVATAGWNLAVAGDDFYPKPPRIYGFILRSRAVKELIKALKTYPGEVNIRENVSGDFSFELGDYTLSSKSVDGNFPKYRKVIPEIIEHKVLVPVLPLLQFVKGNKAKSVELRFSHNKLTLFSTMADVGSSEKGIHLRCAEEFTKKFNPAKLHDLLLAITEKEIIFEFEKDGPLKVVSNGTLHVLMNMRTQ
jgi:DNA polymerase-3 subunit beta